MAFRGLRINCPRELYRAASSTVQAENLRKSNDRSCAQAMIALMKVVTMAAPFPGSGAAGVLSTAREGVVTSCGLRFLRRDGRRSRTDPDPARKLFTVQKKVLKLDFPAAHRCFPSPLAHFFSQHQDNPSVLVCTSLASNHPRSVGICWL